jgi:hypothetical protein
VDEKINLAEFSIVYLDYLLIVLNNIVIENVEVQQSTYSNIGFIIHKTIDGKII